MKILAILSIIGIWLSVSLSVFLVFCSRLHPYMYGQTSWTDVYQPVAMLTCILLCLGMALSSTTTTVSLTNENEKPCGGKQACGPSGINILQTVYIWVPTDMAISWPCGCTWFWHGHVMCYVCTYVDNSWGLSCVIFLNFHGTVWQLLLNTHIGRQVPRCQPAPPVSLWCQHHGAWWCI